jgi:proteasome lid subunit RPN8/RPN11
VSASPEEAGKFRVRLKVSDYEAILGHARAELPNEACGLLGGRLDGDVKTVEKVYLTSNVDASREHFSIDPREQLAAVKDMRANGLVPLGNFHSHPESPARPSKEDIHLAHDPNASYLILSFAEENPVIKAFRVENEIPYQETLEIEQAGE